MPDNETASKLMDHAEALIRERGFNAFSYKDLADAVGIRTASIHYHFEKKSQLGYALMKRYLERLRERLTEAERGRTAKARLRSFVQMYKDAEEREVVCLCGSLASDVATLPAEIRGLVTSYISTSEAWVDGQIRQGIASGEFSPQASSKDLATLLVSGLQGGLVLARVRPESDTLARVERSFWKALST